MLLSHLFCDFITSFLVDHDFITANERENYQYCFEYLFGTIFYIIGITLLSIVFRQFPFSVTFFSFFYHSVVCVVVIMPRSELCVPSSPFLSILALTCFIFTYQLTIVFFGPFYIFCRFYSFGIIVPLQHQRIYPCNQLINSYTSKNTTCY